MAQQPKFVGGLMELNPTILSKMVQDLTKQNKLLKNKINELEDKMLSIHSITKFFLNRPPTTIVTFDEIKNFINSSKRELHIVTPTIDSNFVDLLILAVRSNNISIQVITNERSQIRSDRPDLFQGFDRLQLYSAINHIFNSNTQLTIMLQDGKNILLSSTYLSEKDLKDKFNFIIISSEDNTFQNFKKLYEEQLPAFLR